MPVVDSQLKLELAPAKDLRLCCWELSLPAKRAVQ